jgi:arylsulfatase A-like enzyme
LSTPRRIALVLALLASGGVLIRALTRPRPAERAPLIRLVDELAAARRVEQQRTLLEPEALHLQPGSLKAPAGWRIAAADPNAPAPEVARLEADAPRALRLPIDVPVTGGRDYVVRAIVRDASQTVKLLVQHAPSRAEPEVGWHRATDERAAGGRVRFDWREDVPPDRETLTLLIEAERADKVVIESVSVRQAGAREASLVAGGPAAPLLGLVERPADGVRTVSPRGARRLVPSLLASDKGVYEWALPSPPPAALELETATVPRGADAGSPIEMSVEISRGGAFTPLWSAVRGAPGDGGGWKPARISIPRDAAVLRLATRAAGAGAPQVVAWGNPILRDAAPRKRPPHVLLVTLDAVRADHLNAYGYARPTSRFHSELAARGARFDDVAAQRGHTWASTSSLVTGLFPESSGVIARGARPHRGLRGVTDAFAAAGYTTGRLGSPDLPRGNFPGFDFAELGELDVDLLARFVTVAQDAGDRPLFLWLHLANAHYPWRVADEFNRFDPGYTGPYASGLTRAEFRALENEPAIDAPLRKHLEALYDGAILQMDVRLGRAMAQLGDRGFFDDAIIAVTADHGAHLGEHDIWFMHSTPWNASLAVPLFVVAPGRVPAGTVLGRDRGRALLVDLGPTLLDLAGLPEIAGEGVSLRPLFAPGGRLPARTTVTHFQPAGYVRVENDRYALLWNPSGEPLAWPGELERTLPLPRLGLYDRLADPNEQRDLSAELPLVVGALRQEAEAQAGAAAPKLSTEARQLLIQAGYADDD